MKITDALLPEFDQEMANTRKTLERVPDDKLGWKPKTDLKTSLKLTLDYHLLRKDYELNKMQTR